MSKEVIMRIVIANAKGGVGKTTTAMMLALACQLRGYHARVLDADPQASASLWMSVAQEQGKDLGFAVLPANLVTLKEATSPHVWEFVDCPPSGRAFDQAVDQADFVLIPSSESPTDLQQSWATLEVLPKSIPAALLLCRCERRTRAFRNASEALDALHTPRFDTIIDKRQDLKSVFGTVPSHLCGYADVFSELFTVIHSFTAVV